MTKVAVVGAAGRMGNAVVEAVLAADGLELIGAIDPKLEDGIGVSLDVDQTPHSPYSIDKSLPDFYNGRDESCRPDVLVDFSTAEIAAKNIPWALSYGAHCVVGTTGVSEEKWQEIYQEYLDWHTANGHGDPSNLLVAPNFAIGAVLLMQFATTAAKYMPNVEIVELHHDLKTDSPSGTALRTAKLIAEGREPGRENNALLAYDPRDTEKSGHPERGLWHGKPKPVPVHSVRLPGLVAHQEVIFGGQGQSLTIRHDSIDRSSFMPGVLMAVRMIGEKPGLIIGLENYL